jgi:hypothetical protein
MAEEKRKRGRPRKNPELAQTQATTVKTRKTRAAVQEEPKKSERLTYKPKNAWEIESFKKTQIQSFCEGYKQFINKAKTEREFIREAEILARAKGFKNIDDIVSENSALKQGDKVYRIIKNKMILLSGVGQKASEEGVRIVGAHVDAPRIDISKIRFMSLPIWRSSRPIITAASRNTNGLPFLWPCMASLSNRMALPLQSMWARMNMIPYLPSPTSCRILQRIRWKRSLLKPSRVRP